MSDRVTSEIAQVRLGLEENDESPWEYGAYIERCDNGNWVPLVYGSHADYEDARITWKRDSDMAAQYPEHYRNPRIVRRAVGPWEETER